MFRKRQSDPAAKEADRKEMESVQMRLKEVERRVNILTYHVKVMRRDTTGGMV